MWIGISFTPCPGTKATTLEASVTELKSAGASAIISAMYDKELEKLGADDLPIIAKTQGVQWYQLPLADDAAPNDDFTLAFRQLIDEIIAIVNSKKGIAVHCKGGSGRTGLTIALILVALGYSKEHAKAKVQAIRPKALTHPAQSEFFERFEL